MFCLLASHMANPTYGGRVYIAGQKGRSRWVVENLKKICEKELPGQYKIEVVDVSNNPRATVENNLAALPAVFRTMPALVRKFVGNWANEDSELVDSSWSGKTNQRAQGVQGLPIVTKRPRNVPCSGGADEFTSPGNRSVMPWKFVPFRTLLKRDADVPSRLRKIRICPGRADDTTQLRMASELRACRFGDKSQA
jgi:circadian clock protein KaiB